MKEPDASIEPHEVMRLVDQAMTNWEKLGVVDSTNGLMLPSKIRKRNKAGGFDDTPCMLIPKDRLRDHQARLRAREWAAKIGFNPDRSGPDKDYVLELETLEELAFCIRDVDGSQMEVDGEHLLRRFGIKPLEPIFGEVDHWTSMQGSKFGELTAEQLWEVISEIRKTGTLNPLMSIGGLEQARCILLMAEAAWSSPMNRLSPQSSSTSKRTTDSQGSESAKAS